MHSYYVEGLQIAGFPEMRVFNFYLQPDFLGVIAVSESAKDLGSICAHILSDHTASADQYMYGVEDVFRVITSSPFFGIHFSLALMVSSHTFLLL